MRILLAEDDTHSLKLLRFILESEQCYDVVAVSDGLSAWAELERAGGFGLCIFDIMMPGLDGLELTARLRADRRLQHQPVILCTALNDRPTVDQAAALGVSHYIVKPYARDTVLRQVRRVAEESPDLHAFEPQPDVLARLGVTRGWLRQALSELYADLCAFCAGIEQGELPNGLRLNGLKGAAVNLGARGLASRLAQFEAAVGTARVADWPRLLTQLGVERERLRIYYGLAEAPRPADAEKSTPSPDSNATERAGASGPDAA